MIAVLVFAGTLLLAVLISGMARRTVLSTAVLFLVVGFVAGEGVTGILSVNPTDDVMARFAELALFSVLFTDGMQTALGELRSAWRVPGRALFFGFPLILAGNAVLGHWLAGLPWVEAFLLGAALAPTDPVLAAALVGREEVPGRLRHLLNVESGVNDGLALPFVVILLDVATRQTVHAGQVVSELVFGVGIGLGLTWVAVALLRMPALSTAERYEPLHAFAIGAGVFATASLTHANEFLAAFAAGVTLASVSRESRESFERFGELLTEILKLAALMLFGALVTPTLLAGVPGWGWLFVAAALFLIRPLAISVALLRSPLNRAERATAAWFGPKGFASVVYGLLILKQDPPMAHDIFALIATVVAASIVAHSSTDVAVSRWISRRSEQWEAQRRQGESA